MTQQRGPIPTTDAARGRADPPVRLAASYARSAQTDPENVAEQHRANRARAAAEGFVIPTSSEFLFTDDGTSGRRMHRPGLGRLRRAVREGRVKVECVYAGDLSRLRRQGDCEGGAALAALERELGVKFRFR